MGNESTRQHPALWEGKGAGKGSLVCLSDKSLSVYLNPQCFFICLFKSFPAKKEQKEGGKPPPSVTPPHQDGAGALQGKEQDPGPEHPAPLPSAEPAPCSRTCSRDARSPPPAPGPPRRTCPPFHHPLELQVLSGAFLPPLPAPSPLGEAAAS